MNRIYWPLTLALFLALGISLLKPAAVRADVSIPVMAMFLALAAAIGVQFIRLAPEVAQLPAQVLNPWVVAGIFAPGVFCIYCGIFACAFFASQGFGGAIVPSDAGAPLQAFTDFFYFAAITGSTTGYGDFFPIGCARVVACFQVILMPIVLAAVIQYCVAALRNAEQAILEEGLEGVPEVAPEPGGNPGGAVPRITEAPTESGG